VVLHFEHLQPQLDLRALFFGQGKVRHASGDSRSDLKCYPYAPGPSSPHGPKAATMVK
jgi:hypothetical protein